MNLSTYLYLLNIKGQDGNYDRIIRIPINIVSSSRIVENTWKSLSTDGLLHKFNISDYSGVDRAIFISQFDRDPDNSIDTLWVGFYDYTNKIIIENSVVFSIINRRCIHT